MSCMGECLLMKLSNGVEKYEIEVTKIGQKYLFFLQCSLVPRPGSGNETTVKHDCVHFS